MQSDRGAESADSGATGEPTVSSSKPDVAKASTKRPRAASRLESPEKRRLTTAAEVAQLVGVVLTVIAVISVVWQLNGLRQATETTALIGIYAESSEINRFLLQQPGFRRHFYADDPIEPAEMRNARLAQELEEIRNTNFDEYQRLMSLAELEADQFEQVYSLRDVMPSGQWNVWWAFFIDIYDASPLLRTFYDRNREWYELDDFLRIGDREQRRAALKRP